tara:strand:+ start:1127 stop:2446 length:1320 start_codon:yes stop_codon:yes gene_type:complete
MHDEKNILLSKINSKKAVIGILGMGYVGLPLMLRYAFCGFKVIGFDIDQNKVNKIKNSESYIEHISQDSIGAAVKKGMWATTDFSEIQKVDAIILCVPTPLNKYREPDLSYVLNTLESALPYLRKGQVISLESTTYPGTTEEELLPRIENKKLKVGQDVFLVYSPEREDPGNKNFTTHSIPKVVGGHTANCLEVGKTMYAAAIDKIVPVKSTKAAEMTKLLENIHRAVNIGLVNEMKIVADRMGIDIFEVIDAAATKPFGFTPYYPGPGLGGHCIPIDPFYLTWKAREYGVHTRFIELSGELNASMPDYVINKLMHGLNDRGKSVKGSKILILGLAYKKNVDDERESPCIEILDKIVKKGGIVDYSDPHIPHFKKKRDYNYQMNSVSLTPHSIQQYDAVILGTDHDAFNYSMIGENAALIVDTRGRYRDGKYASKVIKS